ncbi:hypothetical protein RB653_002203 [Dictyostelium firmibasis]|uniref:Uncharacterized protein n=1 Tax=Dictyostelium firmibasis TaxID=79012 RepID=A0AAN7TNF8_9MYCE
MKIKIKNVVDNECTLSNNSGSSGNSNINNNTNCFNTFYHPSDKTKINPYLVWPIKNQGENDYYCLNFLQIFDSPSPLKIKPIIFDYNNLIYSFNKDRIFLFKFIKESNEWILLKSLLINNENKSSFTNKTIHDYNKINNTITLISNEKIYNFKNIDENNENNITFEISSLETVLKYQFFSITSSPIIDLKWSNDGLKLLLITNKKLFLFKWELINKINFHNLFIYDEDIDNINNDFLKVEWIDNENFLITSYPSIQITNFEQPILKLPSNLIKPSIQLFEKSTIEEVEKKEDLLFIKPNINNNNNKNNNGSNTSIIESLFMVNQSINKTNTIFSLPTIAKPLIITESESIDIKDSPTIEVGTIVTNNKETFEKKGPNLLLFKIDNGDNYNNNNKIKIKILFKIQLNIDILTPNIITFNSECGLIAIGSTFSKYIQSFKITFKNGEYSIINHNNNNNNNNNYSIDNGGFETEFSKYKSKGLSILSDNRLYILGGEKLYEKGIGLSFKLTSNWKISLFISIEPIEFKLKNYEEINKEQQKEKQENQEKLSSSSSSMVSSSNFESFLNSQNLILNKLNSIENTLTNHSNRLSSIENSIDLITNHLKINKD